MSVARLRHIIGSLGLLVALAGTSVPSPVSSAVLATGAPPVVEVAAPHGAAPHGAAPRSDHVTIADGTHRWRTVERLVPVRTGPRGEVRI
eukprot:gene34497-38996_t